MCAHKTKRSADAINASSFSGVQCQAQGCDSDVQVTFSTCFELISRMKYKHIISDLRAKCSQSPVVLIDPVILFVHSYNKVIRVKQMQIREKDGWPGR